MTKTKIALIGMATLLVVSLAANVYQYTQLQAMQAQLTASTARIDELSAKLTEQSTLLEKLTLEKKQLNDELAERAGLIKNLNDTIAVQELALDTTPAPEVSKPVTPPAASQPAAPSKPAPAPSQPANNGGGGNQQLSPEEIDRIMKEQGINGGSGGMGYTNPNDEGALSAHGE